MSVNTLNMVKLNVQQYGIEKGNWEACFIKCVIDRIDFFYIKYMFNSVMSSCECIIVIIFLISCVTSQQYGNIAFFME